MYRRSPSLTVAQIRDGLERKDFTAMELATAAIDFAAEQNPKTNAFLTFQPRTGIGRGRTRRPANRKRRARRARWRAFRWA